MALVVLPLEGQNKFLRCLVQKTTPCQILSGFQKPFSVPLHPWTHLAITDPPETGFMAIVVMVDHFSRTAQCIKNSRTAGMGGFSYIWHARGHPRYVLQCREWQYSEGYSQDVSENCLPPGCMDSRMDLHRTG